MSEAIEAELAALGDEAEREALAEEFGWLESALGTFQFALTRPFYEMRERDEEGSGGLLSITVDPNTCKGCGECVAVCDDAALEQVDQTGETVQTLRDRWAFWQDLPTTADDFIRVEDLDQAIGVLDNILLKKEVYLPFTSGDGACLGCSEKTVLRLFTATVEALMQPRVKAHVARLDDLIGRLEADVRKTLLAGLDLSAIGDLPGAGAVQLGDLVERATAGAGGGEVDPAWLRRLTRLIARLRDLRWRYTEGTTGRGRAPMGMLNATGCSSVWGSTFPFNPYPYPWANHLFQDSPSLALGVFEGHMQKMAEGFRAVREAELELAGEYVEARDGKALAGLDWRGFSDEEYALCPPVVVVGGDGAMYDIGLQNLSRAMISGKPLKVVVLDTQVYSNTGGQACTSGFFAQVSDMAAFGAAAEGKQEVRKELGLIGIAHRNTYVMQSTIAYPSHMIEGFIEGLTTRGPALFNCYTSCQPEHGIADDAGFQQARLAVESRAYPLFRYHPQRGSTIQACLDLGGNPDPGRDWPTYSLKHRRHDRDQVMDLPLTFADFAATEGRFRKHFRTVPEEAWHDDMMPLVDYLELSAGEREGRYPFIWHVLPEGRLGRLLVSDALVASTEDRRDFWRLLRALDSRRDDERRQRQKLEQRIRRELIDRLGANLTRLLEQEPGEVGARPDTVEEAAPREAEAPKAAEDEGYMAPWIDSEQCTACDECTKLNPEMFAYDASRKAYIKDPEAGPYQDLVKAAERCPERIIHPGLPRDRSAPDIERWIERGRKYN